MKYDVVQEDKRWSYSVMYVEKKSKPDLEGLCSSCPLRGTAWILVDLHQIEVDLLQMPEIEMDFLFLLLLPGHRRFPLKIPCLPSPACTVPASKT